MSEHTKYNDGGPAFPWQIEINQGSWNPVRLRTVPPGQTDVEVMTGMSLRDWFAGQALALALGGEFFRNVDQHCNSKTEHIATIAYELADAMLAARKEKQ